ncbi:MAG: TerC family protein [Actinomycetota bacterium]
MVPWYLYVGFIAFVLAMLVVDLKMFHAEEHDPTPRESGTWVAIWVTLALLFGGIVWIWKGAGPAGEYFAGYLIEYSLSVDNMFVFVLIFSYFKVPFSYQHQVLFYGILGALIFRGIFIALGVALIQNFDWVIYVFGIFLIITAVRLAIAHEEVDPEHNSILRFLQTHVRAVARYDHQKFFTIENGTRVATPLLIVLLFIELTDIVFAVDSIPAIFGITDDPFIVLTSNVFAILGLRALYFLLADVMGRFHLLKYGLAVILGFVGVKMLLEQGIPVVGWEAHVPIWLSLLVIIAVLLVSGVLSLLIPPKGEAVHPPRAGDDDALPDTDHDGMLDQPSDDDRRTETPGEAAS